MGENKPELPESAPSLFVIEKALADALELANEEKRYLDAIKCKDQARINTAMGRIRQILAAQKELKKLYRRATPAGESGRDAVIEAARKLVKAKGRYHTELNYQALAEALAALSQQKEEGNV